MGKHNQTSITPNSRKELPNRGKGKQTLILEAIRDAAVLSLDENSTRDESEKAIFKFMAEAAFNPTVDTALMANFCLGQIMKKGWPDVKSVMPCVEFEFDENATPALQASQVMRAASDGLIPPDIANTFISSIASMLKIDEVTELQSRLEAIERSLGVRND